MWAVVGQLSGGSASDCASKPLVTPVLPGHNCPYLARLHVGIIGKALYVAKLVGITPLQAPHPPTTTYHEG